MLIWLYRLLLHFYPARYRSTFGSEMADVFQLARQRAWSRGATYGIAFCLREFAGLVLGATHAWARQSRVPAQPVPSLTTAFDGVPTFYTCEDYVPRRSALLQGGILSLAFFSAVTAAFEYGVNHRIFRVATFAQEPVQSQVIETGGSGLLAFGRSVVPSGEGAGILVLGKEAVAAINVRFGVVSLRRAWSNLVWVMKARPNLRIVTAPAFQKPAVPFAAHFRAVYFRTMPVIAALDADHDQVISAAEIANAPAMLRTLDTNHDGKLTADECGSSASAGSDAGLAYMRFHPVLAALDADDDGEISAKEIENAPAALKTLDRNHDGKLTSDEILPREGVPAR